MNPPCIAANPDQVIRLQIAGNPGPFERDILKTAVVYEPGLTANPGQDASLSQPFSSQTTVTVYITEINATFRGRFCLGSLPSEFNGNYTCDPIFSTNENAKIYRVKYLWKVHTIYSYGHN